MIDVNGKKKYSNVYLGDVPISEVYYGRHLIWPDIVWPEGGRYSYTTIMGTSGSSECKTFEYNDNYLWYNDNDRIDAEVCRYIDTFKVGMCIDKIRQDRSTVGGHDFSKYISLVSVDISESNVTSLENMLFSGCTLNTFIMGDKLEEIGNYCFASCERLNDIQMSNSLSNIGGSAFTKCIVLEEIEMPSSVETIGWSAFKGCTKLSKVSNYENCKVSEVSYSCFSDCVALSGITLPSSAIRIDGLAFSGCTSLEDINIENITTIGGGAFHSCTNLKNVTFNDFLLEIKEDTFSYSGLESLKLPSNLISIGNGAFYECRNLRGDVVIPESVNKIDSSAFLGCNSIGSVKMLSKTPPTLGYNVFYNYETNTRYPIFVPCDSADEYRAAPNWSTYADRIVGYDYDKDEPCEEYDRNGYIMKFTFDDPNNIYGKELYVDCGDVHYANGYQNWNTNFRDATHVEYGTCIEYIQGWAFVNMDKLVGDVEIPESVKWIGEVAFSGCTSLNGTLKLPSSLTRIERYTFSNCTSLSTPLDIPSGVNYIANGAFNNCVSMYGSLNIPNSVGEIGNDAFYNCSGFDSISLSNVITSIGDRAFYNCIGLGGDLYLPSTLNNIGVSAFEGCNRLSGTLSIPNGITEIKNSTFKGCSGFNSLTLPNNLTTIEADAFSGCVGIRGEVVIPSTVTSIGARAFKGCRNISGTLTIPSGIGYHDIAIDAFNGCTSIERVVIENREHYIPYVFSGTTCPIYVHCELLDSYKEGIEWRDVAVDRLFPIEDDCGKVDPPIDPDPTPSGDTMFTRTHLDGSEYSIKCDESGTTLTSAMTHANSSLKEISGTTNPCTAITIGDCVTEIGNEAFYHWSKVQGELHLPNGLTSIGDYAFTSCSGFTSDLVIPSSVDYIGKDAFQYCSFGTIKIDRNVPPTLGNNYVFTLDCKIYVPCDSVDEYKKAKNWGLYETQIVGWDFENDKECDGNGGEVDPDQPIEPSDTIMFSRKRLDGTKYEVECGTRGTVITSAITFSGISLNDVSGGTNPVTEMELGNCVTEIGSSAFYNWTYLQGTLVLPSTLEKIGSYAFGNTPYGGTLTIPSNVTSIGDYAFRGTKFTSISLNDGLEEIGSYAFRGCESLTEMVIPSSVTTIGSNVFMMCSSLDSVKVMATVPPKLGIYAFEETPISKIYVPCGSVDVYKAADGWKSYSNKIEGFDC